MRHIVTSHLSRLNQISCGLRLALQRLDVDVEAELAPLLGDQLGGLVACGSAACGQV